MSELEIKKKAQILEKDPIYVAETLAEIIKIMISKISEGKRLKSMQSVRRKLQDFNVMELAGKKAPGGAAIGVSLGLVKNVLNNNDPYYINVVLQELIRRL